MTTTWHARPEDLAAFANAPEQLDDAAAASLEMHLLTCAECRRAVARAADPTTFAAAWDDIADRIDAPSPTPVERFLRVIGVSSATARLVGATRALQLSWLGALAVVAGGAAAVARQNDSAAFFLVIAPVVPVAMITLAFAAASDPAGEAGAAAPLHGLGVTLRRSVAVLAATIAVLVVAATALPDVGVRDATWLLPALAMSTGALALSTWIRVEAAAFLLASAWLVGLWIAAVDYSRDVQLDRLAPFTAGGQVAAAAVVVVAAGAIALRREQFALLGRTA
jgi:hypothetical protein